MLTIIEELRKFMPDPPTASDAELERQILSEGRACDPIVVAMIDGKETVIDGHRRKRICEKHSLPYDKRWVKCDSIEEAKMEMASIAISRRNLNPMAFAQMVGYVSAYERKQGKGWEARTMERTGLNRVAVWRANQAAEAMEKIPEDLHSRLGELGAGPTVVKELAEYEPIHQRAIVKGVEEGEYSSFREALTGDEPGEEGDEIDESFFEPQPDDEEIVAPSNNEVIINPEAARKHHKNAVKLLGQLIRELTSLGEEVPNGRFKGDSKDACDTLGKTLKRWGDLIG